MKDLLRQGIENYYDTKIAGLEEKQQKTKDKLVADRINTIKRGETSGYVEIYEELARELAATLKTKNNPVLQKWVSNFEQTDKEIEVLTTLINYYTQITGLDLLSTLNSNQSQVA